MFHPAVHLRGGGALRRSPAGVFASPSSRWSQPAAPSVRNRSQSVHNAGRRTTAASFSSPQHAPWHGPANAPARMSLAAWARPRPPDGNSGSDPAEWAARLGRRSAPVALLAVGNPSRRERPSAQRTPSQPSRGEASHDSRCKEQIGAEVGQPLFTARKSEPPWKSGALAPRKGPFIENGGFSPGGSELRPRTSARPRCSKMPRRETSCGRRW